MFSAVRPLDLGKMLEASGSPPETHRASRALAAQHRLCAGGAPRAGGAAAWPSEMGMCEGEQFYGQISKGLVPAVFSVRELWFRIQVDVPWRKRNQIQLVRLLELSDLREFVRSKLLPHLKVVDPSACSL